MTSHENKSIGAPRSAAGERGGVPADSSETRTIRVELPFHLRRLAQVDSHEVHIGVSGAVTQRSVLDALEARYPTLRGTIRDYGTLKRRAFLRFFACGEDLAHESPDAPLPEAIATGREPYLIIGAIAGG
jgi:sulfur-carrier protein